MDIQTILIFTFLLLAVAVVIVVFVSNQMSSLKEDLSEKESDKVLMEWLKDMRGSVDKTQETMEKQLQDQRKSMDAQTKMIWERLDNAAKVIGGVQKQLGGIEEFGKDMKDLSNVLKSPKLRGNLGERFLYEILENYLPKTMYKTQYKFRDGAMCDAMIVTDRGMIPVDSKFPMENFEGMLKADSEDARTKFHKEFIKDVKKRVDEISKKYILPEEGTTDQAIMYIPSESVYYEAVVRTAGIEEYAQRKNVLITSPNTFTSFVNIVMVGYQQNELAEHATEILKALAGIQVEAEKFGDELDVLDGHINRTTKSMDNVKGKFGRLTGKISAVEALGSIDDNENETSKTLPEG
jgi:DNA recombination protein RmuC